MLCPGAEDEEVDRKGMRTWISLASFRTILHAARVHGLKQEVSCATGGASFLASTVTVSKAGGAGLVLKMLVLII